MRQNLEKLKKIGKKVVKSKKIYFKYKYKIPLHLRGNHPTSKSHQNWFAFPIFLVGYIAGNPLVSTHGVNIEQLSKRF